MGLGSEDLPAVSRRGHKALLQGGRHGLDDHEVTQSVKQVNGEAAWLVAGFNDIIDKPEQPGLVLVGQGFHGAIEQTQVRHAK